MNKATLVGPALAALALLTGCATAPSAPDTISPAASTGHALTRKSSGWASVDTATLTPGGADLYRGRSVHRELRVQ